VFEAGELYLQVYYKVVKALIVFGGYNSVLDEIEAF